jgi:hypothetical protein
MSKITANTFFRFSVTGFATTILGSTLYHVGTSGLNCIKHIAMQNISLFAASFLGSQRTGLELDWTDTIPSKNLFCYVFSKTCDPSYQMHIDAMKTSELLNPNLFYKVHQQDLNHQLNSIIASADSSTTSWWSLNNWANWLTEKFMDADHYKTTAECKHFEFLTNAAVAGGTVYIAYKLMSMIPHLHKSYRK